MSSKQLKELNGLKIYFLDKYFDPSAAIDIKNIQYIDVSLPFFEEKLAYLKGCVVTDIFSLKSESFHIEWTTKVLYSKNIIILLCNCNSCNNVSIRSNLCNEFSSKKNSFIQQKVKDYLKLRHKYLMRTKFICHIKK